jgi:P4 family phage/plasmid primase-like protien
MNKSLLGRRTTLDFGMKPPVRFFCEMEDSVLESPNGPGLIMQALDDLCATQKAKVKTSARKSDNEEVAPDALPHLDHPVYEEHGQAVVLAGKKPKFNETAVAHRFGQESLVHFDEKRQGFIQYDAKHGLWLACSDNGINKQIVAFLKTVAAEYGRPEMCHELTTRTLTSIASMVKCVRPAPVVEPGEGLFKVGNGVLDLRQNPPKLLANDPRYGFRTGCAVNYSPKAECPEFKKQLLGLALAPEDISLTQRYFGSILLGPNHCHRILALQGDAASGKTTLLTILEQMLGLDQVAELRVQHLAERFEFAAFQGKRILVGKDLPSDTLSRPAARHVKALVGGDALQSEEKYVPGREPLQGNFHVLLTSNKGLRICLDGDEEAWRRRLLVVPFVNRVKKLRLDLARHLLDTEAEGILAWMVQGAVMHLKERATGNFKLTVEQQVRVDDMIARSKPVEEFVRAKVMKDKKCQVTVQQLGDAYTDFCHEKKWKPLTQRQFQNELNEVMAKVHVVAQSHDLTGPDKKRVRGFRGVRLQG